MTQEPERVQCPHCQAANFPSSVVCWQCGRPLQAQQGQPPPEYAPGAPSPPQPEPVQPEQAQPAPPHPPRPPDNTKSLVTLGFVFAPLAIVLCCPIFAIVALILGIVALRRGNPTGIWIIVASGVGLFISVFIFTSFTMEFMKGLTEGLRGQQSWSPGHPR